MALHTRPRDLLAVALPISAGTLLQFVVVLTDNYFLSKLPESAINGAGNAGLVYLTLEMLAIASAAASKSSSRAASGKATDLPHSAYSEPVLH